MKKEIDCLKMKEELQRKLLHRFNGMTAAQMTAAIDAELSASQTPIGRFWRRLIVSISLFLLILSFSSGCDNNEKRTTAKPSEVDGGKLTLVEQAEVHKYIKKHGRDAIMYYLWDEWKKLEKGLNEVANTTTYEEIEDGSEALFREAKNWHTWMTGGF